MTAESDKLFPTRRSVLAAEAEAAMRRVVAAWNEAIPANHVRRVNLPRLYDLRALLESFDLGDVLAVIHHYGGQVWNRQRGAWMTFDSFIDLARFTRVWEAWQESLERSSRVAPPKGGPVAELIGGVAGAARPAGDQDDLRRRWATAPPEVRSAAWRQAQADIKQRRFPAALLTRQVIEDHAMRLWAAGATTGDSQPPATAAREIDDASARQMDR